MAPFMSYSSGSYLSYVTRSVVGRIENAFGSPVAAAAVVVTRALCSPRFCYSRGPAPFVRLIPPFMILVLLLLLQALQRYKTQSKATEASDYEAMMAADSYFRYHHDSVGSRSSSYSSIISWEFIIFGLSRSMMDLGAYY